MTLARRAFVLTAAITLVGAALGYPAIAAEQITGAGSTFVYPVLSKWSADYSKSNGLEVNYQSIGSG
ncbi:MAG: substrate-binding domain-containing protein, partial [Acetobacteraceae bacterium]|nr:substrate-binding domain-containing protein [Acetobacteraceae bacterium]